MTAVIERAPAGAFPPPVASARRPGPPRPPRRLPRSMKALAPLSSSQLLVQSISAIVAALLLGFVLNLAVLSHVQHFVGQQQAEDALRAELLAGTAPVSEGDFDDVLLANGAPVAILDIPKLGVHETVVEGTGGADLKNGPGHRRDTVLPGQAGLSVIMGRAAAYGGPFSRIQELAPGDRFTVFTGQGLQKFSVLGVRYAGDPAPPPPSADQSRLILQSARGPAFIPTGVVHVEAQKIGEAEARGPRLTTLATLPPQEKALGVDTTTAWALVFALQFFVVAEIAAVWSFRRIGAQKTWVVFAPVFLLGGLFVADQVTRFLPNLL